MTDSVDLAELERLEREATAGPWTKAVMGGVQVGELRENTLRFCGGGLGELFQIETENGHYIGREDLTEEAASFQAHRDEQFLVTLRNSAPELLRRARRLERVERFLREHGDKLIEAGARDMYEDRGFGAPWSSMPAVVRGALEHDYRFAHSRGVAKGRADLSGHAINTSNAYLEEKARGLEEIHRNEHRRKPSRRGGREGRHMSDLDEAIDLFARAALVSSDGHSQNLALGLKALAKHLRSAHAAGKREGLEEAAAVCDEVAAQRRGCGEAASRIRAISTKEGGSRG